METLVELILEPKGQSTNTEISLAVHYLRDLLPNTTILVYSPGIGMQYVTGVEIYTDCFVIDRRRTIFSEQKQDFGVEKMLDEAGMKYEFCRAVPRVRINDIKEAKMGIDAIVKRFRNKEADNLDTGSNYHRIECNYSQQELNDMLALPTGAMHRDVDGIYLIAGNKHLCLFSDNGNLWQKNVHEYKDRISFGGNADIEQSYPSI